MEKSTSKLFQEAVVDADTDKDISEDAIQKSIDDMGEMKDELMENHLTEPTSETLESSDDIQDIIIEGTKRKRFRINGDNDKIIELDTTDLGISYRLQESYDRLNKLMEEVSKVLKTEDLDTEDVSDEDMRNINSALKQLDDSMKKEIDYIFDYPVSDKCCEGGSMYAPKDGMYRYEYIIDTLTSLYENDLNREFRLMKQRIKERTKRFTSPTKKKYRPK